MRLKLLFIAILLFESVKGFIPDNFCFLVDHQNFICKRHQCGNSLCSLDEKSCTNLEKWSNLTYKNTPFLNEKRIDEYFVFFSKIKECKIKEYIKLPSIICSNKYKCKRENQSFFRYIIGLKPKECFCSGKSKYDCGNEMCAFNM